MDREIAFKIIKPGFDSDTDARSKFIVEAIVTGNLDHPNIVPVHDLGLTQENKLFYTMKLVKGVSWKDVLGQKMESENIDILLRVCDAVAFAHDKGIVHRDIKPENVMLGDYGEVMLMGLGGLPSAPATEGKWSKLADRTNVAGTPAYMAPEIARA